ncbi:MULTISPECIES: dienelactone hydrolase family protein [Roseateles]|uniref:Dienelactone hydrolase family protein n=1 Tax=Pelomonas caseinilytica TaxID=2906763 RepID=A0ABS8X9F0_9BURK|nr:MULTISPECIES: dienelactone hydrolase family protein [unclassified Roseateles]MCE4536240.1 dienelactone hydrolase family protein [Pelomonas sp. P7]HEV6967700.1 dienelactone hydrolase family protein [Roseateles sp.]
MLKDEIDSLAPGRDFSRRGFVQTAVGSGFAAAVLPVTAQAIATDAKGLEAGPVTIPVGDFAMPAYRAMPAGKTRPPVVLVACEIFGVHEHIADVCRRLAKQGYLAVAPDLFARHGNASAYTDIPKLISEVVSKATDGQVNGDLDATVAWAAAHGGDTSRLGVTGFCWGGRTTWLYTAHSAAVKAAVAWYGPVARAYHPGDKTVIELAASIHAPVLGLYGAADGGIPVDTLTQLEAALKSSGNAACEFVVYPDTPHAFFADYRPSYRPAAAEDAWGRCLSWFKKNGVA